MKTCGGFKRTGRILVGVALLGFCAEVRGDAIAELFHQGVEAYRAGNYTGAVSAFQAAADLAPSGGIMQNLGNAEWQAQQVGPAVLAWERALWVDPLERSARANLRFARKAAQLESPQLGWYEVVSTWLPANAWGWLASVSLWIAVGVVLVPHVFRRSKAGWHQAVSALALTLLFLSLPALVGVHSRARVGFVIAKDTPLRMTPTEESQFLGRMASGDPGRVLRIRGRYALIRTPRATGWVENVQFSTVSGRL
jgi:hypothetical protein